MGDNHFAAKGSCMQPCSGGCTGEKGGSGFLRCLSGRYIRFVVKSPQFGLILAKGVYQDQGRSQEIANYRSLFLRFRIIRVFRRNGLITSLKNVPNRPFWEANLRFYGLEYSGKTLCDRPGNYSYNTSHPPSALHAGSPRRDSSCCSGTPARVKICCRL